MFNWQRFLHETQRVVKIEIIFSYILLCYSNTRAIFMSWAYRHTCAEKQSSWNLFFCISSIVKTFHWFSVIWKLHVLWTPLVRYWMKWMSSWETKHVCCYEMVCWWYCGTTAHIYDKKQQQSFTSVHLLSQTLTWPRAILNFSFIHKIENLLTTKALPLTKNFLRVENFTFSLKYFFKGN